nr:uncharacterized protein LOC111424186 [Onthophagus taurus]
MKLSADLFRRDKLKYIDDDTTTAVEQICYKPLEVKPCAINFQCTNRSRELYMIIDAVYVVDLMLAAVVKFAKRLKLTQSEITRRPSFVVICDIYSLIPQELLYSGNENYLCVMRVNRAFRFVRLGYMLYKSYNHISRHILMYIVDYSLLFTLLGFIRFCVYCTMACGGEICVKSACDAKNFLRGLISSMQHINERRVENQLYYTLVWAVYILCTVSLGFFFRGLFTVHLIRRGTHQHIYMYRHKLVRLRNKLFNIPEYIRNSAEKGFKIYWEQCRGYSRSKNIFIILSPVMFSEILMDISWPAFKHSKLFRSMNLPFLREVSLYMEQIYLLPGEIIYRKGELKQKMIYVVSGTISILSEEDGETPIISFTSGTVIGETSLFLSSKSTNFVQCQTFCQLHILEQQKLSRISSKFPYEYKSMKSSIYDRFNYAIESNKIVAVVKNSLDLNKRNIDFHTTFWLKNILHCLLSTSAEAAARHDFQNIHLMREFKEDDLRNLLFCANNLDMLVIAERMNKTQDTNFARLKFPYILHESSFILKLWELFIVIWTLVFSFAIPYMVFASDFLPTWYYPLILFGTFVFMVDIYIQISTTIKTPSGVMNTLKKITTVRFQSFGFWLDIFSCLPFEVFNPIAVEELTSKSVSMMHLNRVLKIWRIARLFSAWMNSCTANHVVVIYCQYTWIFSYVTFSLFMYLKHTNPDSDLLHLIYISAQWARGLEFTLTGYVKNNTIYTLIQEYVGLTILSFYGSISYIHVIKHFNVLRVQEISAGLIAMVKRSNLKAYSPRIINYLLVQWHSNRCYHLYNANTQPVYFSKTTLAETIDTMYGDQVRKISFFQYLSDNSIYNSCDIMTVLIFAPNEIITYYGGITSYNYIVINGIVEMINSQGEQIKIIKDVFACNLIEVMLQMPNAHTFRAITHCIVLRFDRTKFFRKLLYCKADFVNVKTTLKASTDIKIALIDMTKDAPSEIEEKEHEKKNFFVYPLMMEKDSFQEYDFFIHYDRLYPFEFLRYFFLRLTIIPDGTFLYVWQWIRSVFVLLTTICYFVPVIIVEYAWILNVLDVLALIDIYIRLHVCFYDKNGLLITHPLQTARNYAKSGLLVDIFSIIPFRYMFTVKRDWGLMLVNINHFLQLHIYLQQMKYIRTDIVKPVSKWYSLFYVPFILVLCNGMGMLIFTLECTISEDSKENNGIYVGYTCIKDSILENSPFLKPISLTRAHLYYVYISTVLMTNVSFQGPILNSDVAKLFFIIGLFVSLYVGVKLIGQLQQLHFFGQNELLENQIAMKHLKKHLDTTIRDSKLRKTIIRTFELKWLRLQEQGVFRLVAPFTLALRTDILFQFYGKNLVNNSPFLHDSSLFFKNILPLLKFDLIMKGGFLQTINDIGDYLCIVYQGMADVLAPDGTTLQTLQAGSICGNISSTQYARLKLSIVATTHVEILLCKTRVFINLLQYYPELLREFEMLRAKYIYYVPTQPGIVRINELENAQRSKNVFVRVLEPNSHFVIVWTLAFLIFACYFGVILDIYQIGSGDYSMTVFTIQYVSDLMYLAHFLLQDRVAYENEWGYMVYNVKQIKKRNRENKFMLMITIISIFPVDVLIYTLNVVFTNNNSFNGIYRLNRTLKIAYLIKYIQIKSRKLDVNLFLLKLSSISLCSFLIVNVYASIISTISCTIKPNLAPEIPSWDERAEWTSDVIFLEHLPFLHIVWSAFTVSQQQNYVPQGTILIILFVFTMISGYYFYMAACCEVFSIVNGVYVKKGQYLKLYYHIKYFLLTQNLSASLRMKCISICSALWINCEGEMSPRLLEEMSPYLRDATMNCAFKFFVGAHPIWDQCHNDFIRQVTQKIRYRIYYPDEYVQFKGAIDRTMYFIFDGEVHKLMDEYMNNDKIEEILYKGDSFGIEQGLQKRKAHDYSYRCKRTSTILCLHLFEWEYLLKFFPASRQILFNRIIKGEYF